MTSKVKKNYLYNLFYQVLLVALPVITTPYVSRVLGSEKIGIWSFTFSIVTYFTLVGSLGVAMYGRREIARHQDDIKKRTEVFWQINIIKWITLFLSLLIFYFTCVQNQQYGGFYAILMLEIFYNIVDISWFFQGIENFKTITIRNTIIKILSVISIFVFVHTADDLWIYILIHALSDMFGGLSLWAILPKYINKKLPSVKNARAHIVPILLMFLPQIAVQVYTILDKTMLGFLVPDISETGIYEQSQNIVKIALTLVTSLGTVMSPRIASLAVKKDHTEIKNELSKSFHLVWYLALPICAGIIAIAPNLVPWFLGEDFIRAIPVMQIGALLLLAIGLNNVSGVQYLVPAGKENAFTVSVVIGAITNVIGNLILIPMFGAIGAVISSVMAETIIFFVQTLVFGKKMLTIKDSIKESPKCLISAIIMFAVVYPLSLALPSNILTTAIIVLSGATVYGLGTLILKESWTIKYINDAKRIIFKGRHE